MCFVSPVLHVPVVQGLPELCMCVSARMCLEFFGSQLACSMWAYIGLGCAFVRLKGSGMCGTGHSSLYPLSGRKSGGNAQEGAGRGDNMLSGAYGRAARRE